MDVNGLWTIRNYKLAELSANSLGHANDRIDLKVHVGWRDATRVADYGRGMKTAPANRTNFRFKQAYTGGSVKAPPVSWIALGGGVDVDDYKLENSTSPNYIHQMVSSGIDWRPSPGYARRGGLYELRYHNYRGRDDSYSFDRLEAEVVQHLPLLRENWVISTRGIVNTVLRDTDNPPFFLLPSLGSSDTLRGYSAWRFRDRHSLLVQGEFRWIPNRTGIDMAFFFDAGKVTSARQALDLKGLKKDFGVELRFHSPSATPLRLGIARGSEGWHLVFGGSAAF